MPIGFASLEDAPALERLEQRAFAPELYHRMRRSQFARLLQKGNADILVARDIEGAGGIIGAVVILYRRTSFMGRLYSIAVDPDYQGGAAGKMLFDAMEKRVIEKGLRGVMIEIRADNHRHLERYLNRGYVVAGSVADYYPDGASCIKLKKVF